MLKTILERFDNKRDAKILVTQYGNYSQRETEAIYNDNDKRYVVNKRDKGLTEVSTVNSFIDFIREELDRNENGTGKFATVIIDEHGGTFSPDDDFDGNDCKYERSLTAAWKAISSVANCKINHEQLLSVLQKLRPFIEGFEKLYLTLLDIRTIGRSEMISNPVFVQQGEDGLSASSGYKISYKMQSGTQEDVVLPNHFVVKLPYSKGRREVLYDVPVELMYLNNGSGRVEILFQISELEQIEETALQDEVDFLKQGLAEFKELLVLLNY